ncbi:PREDICTED: alpha-tocopherol transfer protein-like [Cyphomyrmex costatus]|uniref:Alpha-tocopherol transfer protein n=1 Tax=Cyphomyrmex costatus TaxID=456900 RepID=A0A151ILQ9_9HYME|nr:PREDICTED: alpha-tocopherol transfer protein-like [Cyphomyrmex costatus]XP_018407735.1 PREDICTED: alpha-tocopherol transfer protein-like [Cyphomyrmex costatus]KYN05825.1 Alpha-tocopherol transfer protein [Cyphomyrmex costatus]
MASNYSDDSVVHQARQELTSEDKEYAAVYLNETDETRENIVTEIKCWIEESDDLRARKIDDFLILRFLRVCKFNLEKTKIRMRNYYKQRFYLPDWYMNKDPFRPELQELFNLGVFLPLRKPDNHGRLVIIVCGTRHDPRKHKISDIAKIGVMATEIATKNYTATSVYGCSVFIDIANPTMRHVLQMQPQIIKNLVQTWQSSYPMRIQLINMINAPKYVDIVLKIFRTFMNEKMKNRLHVYSQNAMHNCFKDIPANILPVEYGGIGGTRQELAKYWKKLIEENSDWLMEDEKDIVTV